MIAWIAVLIAVLAASTAIGTHNATDFSLNGTQSQQAEDVLTRDFPSQSGDVDQIVFHARAAAR